MDLTRHYISTQFVLQDILQCVRSPKEGATELRAPQKKKRIKCGRFSLISSNPNSTNYMRNSLVNWKSGKSITGQKTCTRVLHLRHFVLVFLVCDLFVFSGMIFGPNGGFYKTSLQYKNYVGKSVLMTYSSSDQPPQVSREH